MDPLDIQDEPESTIGRKPQELREHAHEPQEEAAPTREGAGEPGTEAPACPPCPPCGEDVGDA
jgi:hypothetical protein